MQITINIPKRGQKLTNGDMLKSIFPDIEYGESESKLYPGIFGWIQNEERTKDILVFKSDKEWWNEPYKRSDAE